MAIFTKLNNENLSEITKVFWNITELKPINWWTDNSVYCFKTNNWNVFVYKLYEWKSNRFIIRLLSIHNRINDILSHQPLLKTIDLVSWKIAIIFNFIKNNNQYNLGKIIEFIYIFHLNLNKWVLKFSNEKTIFFDWIQKEMEFFRESIKKDGYILKYPDYNIDILWDIFNQSLSFILSNKNKLQVWFIHNDLNRWNIINTNNWVEFIDFDWVNKNLILKEYIILIIRFNIFDKLDYHFKKTGDDSYIIWVETISYNLIKELYKLYSINLIFNMIYYIWYDKKEVTDEMYWWDNQSWQEIFKNLQNNKIL